MNTNFDAKRFLNHLKLQLRNLHIDLSPINGGAEKAELMEGNPRECYLIEFFGHTPDYPKHGDTQPAYKVKGYAYPASREFYLQVQYSGEWHDILWPSCNGMTPAEKALRENGLVGFDMTEWQVIAE